MSVGGGYKKGKAEFAVKDVNGKDITIATESFGYIGSDKVLNVNGIDINITDSNYGIHFKDEYGDDFNIYLTDTGLVISNALSVEGDIYPQSNISFTDGGGIVDINGNGSCDSVTGTDEYAFLSNDSNGKIHWKKAYDVHCWLYRSGNITCYIYSTFDTPTLYEALNSVPTDKINEYVINVRLMLSAPQSNYIPTSNYTISKSENNITLSIKCIAPTAQAPEIDTFSVQEVSFTIPQSPGGAIVKIF